MAESEIHLPTQLNAHGDNAMPVIKSGLTTGTIVGWVKGLKSVVRYYSYYDPEFTALETTIVQHLDAISNDGAYRQPYHPMMQYAPIGCGRVSYAYGTSATRCRLSSWDACYEACPFSRPTTCMVTMFPRATPQYSIRGYGPDCYVECVTVFY